MPQLLLEIFSEEIPARMQQGAARDLERLISDRFKTAGLNWDALTVFAGPRRLTLVIEGLPNKLVADRLNISVRTVEVHRSRVFDKMGVKSAVELANALRQLGAC